MNRVALLSIVALALGAAGCGGSSSDEPAGFGQPEEGPTVVVAVTDLNGSPIERARVQIVGTDYRGETDASGNARFQHVKPTGVFTVEAGTDGYFRDSVQVTVTDDGDPPPTVIALRYAPPLGNFVYQPKSTHWYVLSIESFDPWSVQLHQMEWGCWSESWTLPTPKTVQLDEGQDALTFDYGRTIPIVGPGELGSAWQQDFNGSLLPDTSSRVAPVGACNGSDAAWDSGNG